MIYKRIEIHAPLGMSTQGKRSNNEDSLWPAPGQGQSTDRLFVLCDGVGGMDRGEVASQLACESLGRAGQSVPEGVFDQQAWLEQAYEQTQALFDKYVREHPESEGMATTVCVLLLGPWGATLGHCGDSRIYHFRGRELMHRTRDHSMANMMFDRGLVTAEEAANIPRNQIGKALMANKHKDSALQFATLDDLAPGDLFVLCSDGVNESLSDDDLAELAAGDPESDGLRLEEARQKCQENSRDNSTLLLVRLAALRRVSPLEKATRHLGDKLKSFFQ